MTSSGPRSTVMRGVGVNTVPLRLQGARPTTRSPQDEPRDTQSSLEPEPTRQALQASSSLDVDTLEAQRELARRIGYEEGHLAGLAAARQRLEAESAAQRECHEKAIQDARTRLEHEQIQKAEALSGRFEALYTTLCQQVASQLKDLEVQAANLAFLSLQKIFGGRTQRVEALRTLIERQVGELHGIGELRIHLNPTDLEVFGQGEESTLLGGAAVRIVPDARLPLGGCIVHSAKGHLDIGLPGQLERLGQVWLESLAQEPAPTTENRKIEQPLVRRAPAAS